MSKQKANGDEGRELLALIGAALGEEELPTRVVVTPWGAVKSSAGEFVVDEESGQAVVAAFDEHGTDLPIDFEHQTLGGAYASPDGTAPAAGWITGLEAVPDKGIVATVNWTEEAKRMIAGRQYRYLSPVVLIRRSDRKVIGLHSVALTNKPAIVDMTAIVNRTAADGDVVLALRERLSLGESATVAEVLIAARERIDALESASAAQDAESAVAAAMSAGKLSQAQRQWALEMAMQHRPLFDAWLETAPVVVALGRLQPPQNGERGTAAQSAAIQARQEYRSNRLLQALTTEEAYVAHAVS